MANSEKNYKDSNINYMNKDFISLKSTLMEYAKTYFPNTYRDFNETSPGMMLIEMSAYVGDVLNFYIDQQYKEMLLPLAEERKNIVNLATMLGYKVKPTTPAKADIRVTIKVDANLDDINNPIPNFSQGFLVKKGMQLKSSADPSVIYETLEDVDFTISTSLDPPHTASSFDSTTQLVNKYTLTRYVLATAGKTITKTFTVGSPEKFLELALEETNVIEVLDVTDANGNRWYETQYLAQDKVPLETPYYEDDDSTRKTNAYYDTVDGAVVELPVPYTLSYILSPKRFVTEVDENNITKLVFGNGLLRTGTTSDLTSVYNEIQTVGFVAPGSSTDLDTTVGSTLGSVYSSLGETPANTILTVKYRIGGGLKSNIPMGDLTTINESNAVGGSGAPLNSLATVNDFPARGGSNGENIEEIRHRAKAFFTTQDRCVTREDYEARVMNLPSRFGNIAKVHVRRAEQSALFNAATGSAGTAPDDLINVSEFEALYDGSIPTIEIFTLSYDQNKNLVNTPTLVKSNLKQYLARYRIITDTIQIRNGYIINFGVLFDVVAHKYANKAEVKLKCIETIKEYFRISKMFFRQPLYKSQLEYELMGVDGVRAVNFVTLTQYDDYLGNTGNVFDNPLYNCTITAGCGIEGGTVGYGYNYSFNGAQSGDKSIILPSVDPAVFELKKPNENIKGVVR